MSRSELRNDDQEQRLTAALADAFDLAATTCGHKVYAAKVIRRELRRAGFVIVSRSIDAAASARPGAGASAGEN
jgi:hypothetical protein